jgi:hypothetical protein
MGGHSLEFEHQLANQRRFDQNRAVGFSAKWAALFLLVGFCPNGPLFALTVDRATLHQFEDGPVLPASHIFLPGETVFLGAWFKNYQVTATDDRRNLKLSWRAEVADPAGIPVVASKDGQIADTLSPQDKDWAAKLNYQFTIPPYAGSGNYRVKLTAKDELSGTDVSAQVSVAVRGHFVEPSETLVARNLHFLRTEEDGPPITPPVFHPGEILWARFDITGYKFGAKNAYSVEYGLAVLRETGEQVFAQPAAAADAHESFYPQRYVPGALSLNLAANVPAGSYILVVTMQDKLDEDGVKAETRAAFRIEPK